MSYEDYLRTKIEPSTKNGRRRLSVYATGMDVVEQDNGSWGYDYDGKDRNVFPPEAAEAFSMLWWILS